MRKTKIKLPPMPSGPIVRRADSMPRIAPRMREFPSVEACNCDGNGCRYCAGTFEAPVPTVEQAMHDLLPYAPKPWVNGGPEL